MGIVKFLPFMALAYGRQQNQQSSEAQAQGVDPLREALTVAQDIKKQVDAMVDAGIAQIKATAPQLPLPQLPLPKPSELLKSFENMLPQGFPKLSELIPSAGGTSSPATTVAYTVSAGATPGAEIIPAEVEVVEAEIPTPSMPSGESLGEAEELEVTVSTAKPAREMFEIVEA